MSEWKHGFCDCCGNLQDCLIGYICPPAEAYIATTHSGRGPLMGILQCLCYPLLVPILRNNVRHERNISGNCCGDIAAGWCCPCCTVIQIKREFD